jgi:predicted O-methyltransferase YrrM
MHRKTRLSLVAALFALTSPLAVPAQDGGPARPPDGPPPGGRPPGPPGGGDTSFFKSPVLPKDDDEKKILDVLDDLDKNQRRGMMNVPMDDGRFLRMLAESTGAKHVVEIGTSNGYSGIWFCLALRKTEGKLTTHEIDAGRAAKARENFKRAGVDGLVTLVEGDAHETVVKLEGPPIDLLFLDADKEGYIDYLEKLLPKVRPGGLVVGHNINTRQADPRFVKAITSNPALETILVNMGASGVSLSMKKR